MLALQGKADHDGFMPMGASILLQELLLLAMACDAVAQSNTCDLHFFALQVASW